MRRGVGEQQGVRFKLLHDNVNSVNFNGYGSRQGLQGAGPGSAEEQVGDRPPEDGWRGPNQVQFPDPSVDPEVCYLTRALSPVHRKS